VLQVNDPTGTDGFAYDNIGRLVGTSTQYAFLAGPTIANAYTYDAASNRTSLTDGSVSTYGLEMLPDDGDWLSGSDVVARVPVVFAGGVEVVSDNLLSTPSSVAVLHGGRFTPLRLWDGPCWGRECARPSR